jgi:hypothetical protein
MTATAEIAQFRAASLADVFRRVWPRHAAKLVARATGSPVATARRWVAGETEPRAGELIRLMAEHEEVAAEVNRIVGEMRSARALEIRGG